MSTRFLTKATQHTCTSVPSDRQLHFQGTNHYCFHLPVIYLQSLVTIRQPVPHPAAFFLRNQDRVGSSHSLRLTVTQNSKPPNLQYVILSNLNSSHVDISHSVEVRSAPRSIHSFIGSFSKRSGLSKIIFLSSLVPFHSTQIIFSSLPRAFVSTTTPCPSRTKAGTDFHNSFPSQNPSCQVGK